MTANVAKKGRRREQFTEIYSDYYQLVFSVVYTKVGNYNDADDITQEVFITFYEKFDEVENPRKWLLGALKNMVLQYYEKKKKAGADIDIDEIFKDVSLTFVNGFRDARIIIEEAIENVELTDEQRLILNYVAYHTYSYSEVGKMMGFSKDQVSYKYNNIVKEILTYLRRRGIRDFEELL